MMDLDRNVSFPLMIAGIMAMCLFAVSYEPVRTYNIVTPALAIPPDQTSAVHSTWYLPVSVGDIEDVLSDFAGNVYFSEGNENKIGRLEPTTNMITEWGIGGNASQNASPRGIVLNPTTGAIYFTESGTNKIGRLEPTTNIVTEWNLPNGSERGGLDDRIIIEPEGDLYFTTEKGYSIIKLEPSTNTFTEWKIPSFSSNISDIALGFDAIYFTDDGTNKIGRLEPTTNIVTEWRIENNTGNSDIPARIAFDTTTGTIYFTVSEADEIGRLDPSRGIITKWDIGSKPLEIAATPAGSIFYVDDQGRMGRLG